MSRIFEQTKERARVLLGNPGKTGKLIDDVLRLTSSGRMAPQISGFADKIRSLVRMVKCYIRKEYLDVPWQTIVLATAALVYFVSPVDAISDFLPVIGFTDDAAVLLAVLSSINHDLNRFLEWETTRIDEYSEEAN
ncbi:MAG: DUF1232 domain-containing protein [Chlorobiaceae bacterium]|jgi:uncharacterized membrane protein YkvA (DUF1232 family)|nr:DUF1232 domain-containing protein [Chlorobiaceae bacterium]